MKFSITTICLLVACIAFGQSSTRELRADKLMKQFNYPDAIEVLQGISKPEKSTLSKLAECHRLTGNYDQAIASYQALESQNNLMGTDLYYMAALHRNQGSYEESEKYMKLFQSENGEDSRVARMLSEPGLHNELRESGYQAEIKHLSINSDAQDFAPVIKGQQVFFASSRQPVRPIKHNYSRNDKPFLEIYQAEVKDNFELTEVSHMDRRLKGKFHEGPVTFDETGRTMVFTRNNYDETDTEGTHKLMLFESVMYEGKWSEPRSFKVNNKNYNVGHASLTKDGHTMFFASDMPGGFGGSDIYFMHKNEDGHWTTPVNLGAAINTEGNEMFPYILQENMLFFSSDGLPGLGGLDQFVTSWGNDTAGEPRNMGFPINDTHDDFGLVLRDDLRSGYFTSNRPGGAGDDDIYSFNLNEELTLGKAIEGHIVNDNGDWLPGAIVTLVDTEGNRTEIVANDTGYYHFEAMDDMEYEVLASAPKFDDGKNDTNTKGKEALVRCDVILNATPEYSLLALVTDAQTGAPVEGVDFKIEERPKPTEQFFTDGTGGVSRPIEGKTAGDQFVVLVMLSKDGYLPKTVEYVTRLDKPGVYEIHESIDLTLQPLSVGADLSKLIDINPIYFDLNKANIRPDASVELDKIVKVMKEYPTLEIELGSHTDCRGSFAYNEKLSDRRAKSSAQYIKDRIPNPDRIYGKGYGEVKVVNKCECEGSKKVPCTEKEHQENRRTEFVITKM